MVEIVFHYQGTVDKYIGDGLMVFFGDPEPQPDHAMRCVRAAMAMQIKARELKQKWQKDQSIPIQIRIGINTGVVVVGNMGSARRLSYTVLGSAVNLAQRLESNAPVEGILISQRTYELVKDHVPTRALGEITVKGITQPMPVYEVLENGTGPR
jgi:adenylate cyclase